jgi:Rho termination factor, N-terminal domain
MPTNAHRDSDPQRPFLDAVRESQAAVIDVVRAWTDITERLTRDLRLPLARIDLTDTVDRVFDVAEQALAAQRQLAHTVAGVATRQIDTAAETVDTAVTVVETSGDESVRQVEILTRAPEAEAEQPQAQSPRQDRRPDGRTYEERSVEELRERASELQIEGRSSMSKDELVAALRNHRQPRSASNDTPKSQPPQPDRTPDRRSYEERSIEELRERARELDIEGRSTMTKDELIAALRQQSR